MHPLQSYICFYIDAFFFNVRKTSLYRLVRLGKVNFGGSTKSNESNIGMVCRGFSNCSVWSGKFVYGERYMSTNNICRWPLCSARIWIWYSKYFLMPTNGLKTFIAVFQLWIKHAGETMASLVPALSLIAISISVIVSIQKRSQT